MLQRNSLGQDEIASFRDVTLETKRTISMLTTYRGKPPKAQELLNTMNYAVSRVAEGNTAISFVDINIEPLLDEIIIEGLDTMEERR